MRWWTFRAILAEGSLSAAARRLGVTLAVVSKRLVSLEALVGMRLIQRNTRSLSSTDEGARLLIDVEHALAFDFFLLVFVLKDIAAEFGTVISSVTAVGSVGTGSAPVNEIGTLLPAATQLASLP